MKLTLVITLIVFLFSNYGCFEDGIHSSLKENKFLVTNIYRNETFNQFDKPRLNLR